MAANLSIDMILGALNAVGRPLMIVRAEYPDFPILFVNSEFESANGLSSADMIGKPCTFMQRGADLDEAAIDALNQLKAGQPARLIQACPRKDGQIFWYELAFSPIQDDQGRIAYHLCFQTDVTEQHNARIQKNLEQSRLEMILQVTQDGLWSIDLETQKFWASQELLAQIGFEPAPELQSAETWLAQIHPDDRAAAQTMLDAYVIGREDSYDAILRIRHAQGHWVHTRSRAVKEVNHLGRTVGLFGSKVNITNQVESAAQLRQAEGRLQLATQVLKLGISDTDLRTGETIWNTNLYSIFGYDHQDFPDGRAPSDWRELIHKDDVEQMRNAHKARLECNLPSQTRFRLAPVHGITRTLQANILPIQDDSGTTIRVIAAVEDISALIANSAEMTRLNQALSALFQANKALLNARDEPAMLAGICDAITADGNYLLAWVGLKESDAHCSVRIAAASGSYRSLVDHLDLTWADAVGGRGPSGTAIRTGRPQVMQNHSAMPVSFEAELPGIAFGSSISVPIILGGDVMGVLTIYAQDHDYFGERELKLVEDFTTSIAIGLESHRQRSARRTAETLLRKAEQRFADVARAAPGMVYQWREAADGTRGYIWVSPNAQTLYNLTPESLIEDWSQIHIHPDDRDRWASSIQESIRTKTDWRYLGRFIPPDQQQRWVQCYSTPEFQANGDIVFTGIAFDVTVEREREAAIEQAQAEKSRSQAANEAKSAFLSSMSHELRTPLNAIVNYAALLKDAALERKLPDMVRDLEKIESASAHTVRLVSNTLDLSKIEAGRMELAIEEINLKDLIDEVADLMRPLICANTNHFEIIMPDQPILIATDHLRLKQILINLLGNAAKFTKAGRVELAVQPLDHMIRFCVTDTGIGIKPDQLPHIFDPYFQVIASANTNPNGTGLGLALVQNFVHLMGGTIVVQSVVGQGSRFQVDLPYMILAEPTLSQYRQVLV